MAKKKSRYTISLRHFMGALALHQGIGLILLVGVISVFLSDNAALDFLRSKVFDTYQLIHPRPIPSRERSPVTIIDLDERSLRETGQWPWPRDAITQMSNILLENGAAVISFDMVFAEDDRSRPDVILKYMEDARIDISTEDAQSILNTLPDGDRNFAERIAKGRIVLGQAVYWHEIEYASTALMRSVVAVRKIEQTDAKASHFLPNVEGMIRNLEILEQNVNMRTSGIGIFSLVPEIDGIVRRIPTAFVYRGILYPSLSIESLRVALKRPSILLQYDQAGIKNVVLNKNIKIPTDKYGRIYPYFSRQDTSKYISASKIFSGDFNKDHINGRIILIGTSAVGLNDLRSIPTERLIPGVEAHAQVIENAMEGSFLERPNYAIGAELVLITLVGLLLIIILPKIGASRALILFLIIAAITFGGSIYLFIEYRILIDAVLTVFSLFVIYLTMTIIGHIKEEGEKRATRDAFSKYLSPDMVERVASNPDELSLGGEMREMTILFCDVRGFTSISELYDAVGLTQLINRLLTPLSNEILKTQGTIDKYMGDCVMAFWNAPLDDENHARHACESGLNMLSCMKPLNASLEEKAKVEGNKFIPLVIGIGINTGPCVVGNMGSDMRFDYSVLGDSVNTTSRLEGQTKTYGFHIIVGETTYTNAPDYAFLQADFIRVKGKNEALTIYGLAGKPEMAQSEPFKALQNAHDVTLQAYRAQRWDEAERHIKKALTLSAKVEQLGETIHMEFYYAMLKERIAQYKRTPPGADWDGVYTATAK